MGSSDKRMLWNKNYVQERKSVLGHFQVFHDKTVTALKSTDLVAYPAHVVLMTHSYSFRWLLIEDGHLLVGLVSVSSEERKEEMEMGETREFIFIHWSTWSSAAKQEERKSVSGQHVNRKIPMSVLHEMMECMTKPLKGCGRKTIEMKLKGMMSINVSR